MDRRAVRWSLLGIIAVLSALAVTALAKPAPQSRKPAQSTQAAQGSPNAQPIQWVHDLRTAHLSSVASDRPMLIVFGGPWCKFCKKLETEVLSNPTLTKYINAKFVPVHLDSSRDQHAAEILEVKGLPTSVILSPQADLLGTIEGFVPVREYAEVLKQAIDYHQTLREANAVAARQPR